MFIHIRDIPEIEKVVSEYPFIKTLLILNHRIMPITTNIADANVEKYNYDYVIHNDHDLVDLDEKAKMFLTLLD